MNYYAKIDYQWYEGGQEKDLVPIAKELGAKIIRQTPMRGLGSDTVWMKILHIKANQKALAGLCPYIRNSGERMVFTPYNPAVHLKPMKDK